MDGDRGESGHIRVDMHLHTRASFDCLSDPDAVVATALARGMDRVCITDHNQIEAALQLRERHGPRVVVGEEVKTAENVDIIGLYLRERIPKGTPARETCERIHAQRGIVYVPHPFASGKGGSGHVLPAIADMVDAIEGFNARIHLKRWNDRAAAWAHAHDKPVGGGSDAHTLREVGRAYVVVPPFDDDAGSFLAALAHGHVHGRFASWAVHLASTYAKLRKPRGRVPTEQQAGMRLGPARRGST